MWVGTNVELTYQYEMKGSKGDEDRSDNIGNGGGMKQLSQRPHTELADKAEHRDDE